MAKKGSKPAIGTKGAAEWYWKRYTELYAEERRRSMSLPGPRR